MGSGVALRPIQARAAVGIAALSLGLALGPGPGRAQDAGPPVLTFGLQERLEASSNPLLVTDPGAASLVSDTSLSLALSTSTRRDSLDLSASTALRAVTGGQEATASDPRFALSYGRQGADASFALNASYLQGEVGFLRPLDLVDPDAGVVDPDPDVPDGTGDGEGVVDLGDLAGEGRRRDAAVSTRLTFGEEGPLGVTLSGRVAATRYDGEASDALEDSRRARAGLGLRLALSPVLDATADLGLATLEGGDDEDEGVRRTTSLDLGFALDRPRGPLSLSFGVAEADEGARTTLRLGRTLDLPLGALSFSLGATRTAQGGTEVVGSLSASRELPRDGSLSAAARRSVATTRDGETVVTTLSAGFARPLTARAGLSLDAAFAMTEDTGSGEGSQVGEAAAQVSWALTRDWSLGTGATLRLRDGSDSGQAEEAALFVTLGRSFATRF